MKIEVDESKYHHYAFVSSYDQSVVTFLKYLQSQVGWRELNWKDSKWRFTDPEIAEKIKARFPETELPPELGEKDQIEATALALKQLLNLDNDFVVNNIKNEAGEILPYQKIGVQFMINCKGKMILADSMGVGKSLQALAYVAHEGIKKTLVICPASVKYSWESEVDKWTNLSSFVIDGKSGFDPVGNQENIIIINYDILHKYFKELVRFNFDCLIMDEFHFIKNSRARRSKVAKLIARRIPKSILLSGTPILSRPSEMFNGLNIIDPYSFNNYYTYATKYCNGHNDRFGWNDKGASNIPELQAKISRYFLRRTKEQVLPQLPKKRFINFPVELSPESRAEYLLAVNNFKAFLRDKKDKDEEEIAKTLMGEALAKVGYLRQITTKGKVKDGKELIRSIVDSGEKVVVFSCYREPLKIFKETFGDEAVMLSGETPLIERKEIIDQFQNNPNVKIFLGGIKSAGVGITLTAASNVVFLDLPWVPADHMQALDRCHRLGAIAESLSIYQMYAGRTIDQMMIKLLARKQKIFDALIEGQNIKKSRNMIPELIKMIEKEGEVLE